MKHDFPKWLYHADPLQEARIAKTEADAEYLKKKGYDEHEVIFKKADAPKPKAKKASIAKLSEKSEAEIEDMLLESGVDKNKLAGKDKHSLIKMLEAAA